MHFPGLLHFAQSSIEFSKAVRKPGFKHALDYAQQAKILLQNEFQYLEQVLKTFQGIWQQRRISVEKNYKK